jgi:hypothetical protein
MSNCSNRLLPEKEFHTGGMIQPISKLTQHPPDGVLAPRVRCASCENLRDNGNVRPSILARREERLLAKLAEGEKKMKPAYWIGILALLGAVVGYIVFRSTGWLGSGLGIVAGILVGVLLYNMLTRKTKQQS